MMSEMAKALSEAWIIIGCSCGYVFSWEIYQLDGFYCPKCGAWVQLRKGEK